MRRRGMGFMRSQRWGQQQNPQVTPALQYANRLLAAGQYSAAALQFETLAKQAPEQYAPFLYFQAGRARIQTGQAAAGTGHIKFGLHLLVQSGRFDQMYRAGQRIVLELRARGYAKEADEILRVLNTSLPATTDMPTILEDEMPGILPTHCPSCGAPLRPDETEWLDEQTAECPYCGSPVHEQA